MVQVRHSSSFVPVNEYEDSVVGSKIVEVTSQGKEFETHIPVEEIEPTQTEVMRGQKKKNGKKSKKKVVQVSEQPKETSGTGERVEALDCSIIERQIAEKEVPSSMTEEEDGHVEELDGGLTYRKKKSKKRSKENVVETFSVSKINKVTTSEEPQKKKVGEGKERNKSRDGVSTVGTSEDVAEKIHEAVESVAVQSVRNITH